MAQSEHWYSNPTQVAWTCDALTRGRTISHKTEIREVNGWRLGAIIHRLKTAYGWPILSERRGPENVAHYRLAPGNRSGPAALPTQRQGIGRQAGRGWGMTAFRIAFLRARYGLSSERAALVARMAWGDLE